MTAQVFVMLSNVIWSEFSGCNALTAFLAKDRCLSNAVSISSEKASNAMHGDDLPPNLIWNEPQVRGDGHLQIRQFRLGLSITR